MKETVEMIKNLPISDTTAKFLACKIKAEDVYNKLYDVVLEHYGEMMADEIMEEEISQPFSELMKKIEKFAMDSISYNLSHEKSI